MSGLDPNLGLDTGPSFNAEQSAVLKRLRVWAGAGIVFCALQPAAVLLLPGGSPQQASSAQISANRAAIAAFVISVIIGISRRMQAYKAQWQKDVVTPQGYRKGISWYVGAVVLGHGAATLVGLWVGSLSASFDLSVFAIGLLVFGFPNGKPMLPHPPQLGGR